MGAGVLTVRSRPLVFGRYGVNMSANFGTSASAGSFQGQPAARPQAISNLLNMPGNSPWWYTHHPAHWQCIDGEWVPDLGQMMAMPGLNRVDKNGDTSMTEVHLNKKGMTVIPWEIEPGGYCIQYPGTSGPVYLSKWEQPKLVAGQLRITPDTAGNVAFRKRLVAEGVIKVPDPDFIDVIIGRQERIVNEHRTRAPVNPGSALALPIEEKRLEEMQAAKAKLYAEPADDAPAKRVRR
jgi:hypothetical protein